MSGRKAVESGVSVCLVPTALGGNYGSGSFPIWKKKQCNVYFLEVAQEFTHFLCVTNERPSTLVNWVSTK